MSFTLFVYRSQVPIFYLSFVPALLILLLQVNLTNASPIHINNLEIRELTGVPTCKTNIALTPSRDECSTHCTHIQDVQKRCRDFYPCMCEVISPAALDSCLKCTMRSSDDTLPTSRNDPMDIITEYSNACSFVKTEKAMIRAYLPCHSTSNKLFGHALALSPAELFRYLIPYMSVCTAAMILIVISDSARKKRLTAN
ncbi:hypothetical protein CPB84DRAFT_1784599 [Gymnopilus junonius]|uniref:Uncharacterized protein n=1 Tax=Gymnopilus junonius TaxID=109634 RepID=A0A9P5NLG2_GYMJU|nr:hypothetical protein CPB84DRAFT_1784599 [Gymnopilus junonius]